MKCKLCGEFFLDQKGFELLFRFPEVCDRCNKRYKPSLKQEVIPTEKGQIDYFYIFDDVSLNLGQRNYLSRHFNLLFKYYLLNKDLYDLVIILDNSLLINLDNWYFILKISPRVLLLSLVFYDLSIYNYLY